MKRRNFVQNSSAALAGLGLLGLSQCSTPGKQEGTETASAESPDLFFKISLAQWSIHSQIKKGTLKHIEFAEKAKSFGVEALEYVSQLFPDENFDDALLKELNTRAEGEGLVNHLIMIDHCGYLAINDETERKSSIEKHRRWIDAAAVLKCSSIRVNMEGDGTLDEIIANGTESLRTLSEYASQFDINVLVENHGGFSSDVDQLVKIFDNVNMSNCGALPDFGNFCIDKDENDDCIREYDRYKGVELLMPYVKTGVSAKAKRFDEAGNEIDSDYSRLLKTVKDSGFTGYIGIEHETDDAEAEDEGIRRTKELLIREGSKLS